MKTFVGTTNTNMSTSTNTSANAKNVILELSNGELISSVQSKIIYRTMTIG